MQIYAGADGTFVMVEDDGESRDYETNDIKAVRHTIFNWNDQGKVLSWKVQGSFADEHTFTQVCTCACTSPP
jgi:hypothetical protein